MILVDVNLLVDATMTAARDHHAARSWLQDHLSQTARVGLAWVAITGFVRVAGQPRLLEGLLGAQPSARLVTMPTWR